MTLAQRFRKQGIEQGIEQGVHKTALKMLQENLALETISKVTELSIDQIKELRAKNQKEFEKKNK